MKDDSTVLTDRDIGDIILDVADRCDVVRGSATHHRELARTVEKAVIAKIGPIPQVYVTAIGTVKESVARRRERAAWLLGWRRCVAYGRSHDNNYTDLDGDYLLHKTPRRRTIVLENGNEVRVDGDQWLIRSPGSMNWSTFTTLGICPSDVAKLADLAKNPTEEVEDT